MTSLSTPLTRMLGIRNPIINAPMTPQAGGALAGAVSDAGGLGMLGFDEEEPSEKIREQLAILKNRVSPNFGIGLVAWVLEARPELLDLAIAASPKMVSISFGDPSPYVARIKEAGILVASQVQSKRWATIALDAGVDILIAQGTEGGGHTGSVGTLPLLQIVLEMSTTPVAAAGGIASGRGLAAVLAAGAGAGWIGTPFLLAKESRTRPEAQSRIASSDETQTIYTSVFDRVQGKAWPNEFKGRALRNGFTDRWDRREDDVMRDAAEIERFRQAKLQGDYGIANVYAGQSVGLLNRVRSAREIVESLTEDCLRRLAGVANLLQ